MIISRGNASALPRTVRDLRPMPSAAPDSTARRICSAVRLPRTTMQRALEALERQHFLRQDLAGATATWRFEDPFMRAWLATLANQ